MVKRTGPTNPYLKELIHDLRKDKSPLFRRLAAELSKSSRSARAVNLSRISRTVRKGEVAVVPGTVLGGGEVSRPFTVAAWRFTGTAEDKIKKSKGKVLSINDLVREKPKKMRIVC